MRHLLNVFFCFLLVPFVAAGADGNPIESLASGDYKVCQTELTIPAGPGPAKIDSFYRFGKDCQFIRLRINHLHGANLELLKGRQVRLLPENLVNDSKYFTAYKMEDHNGNFRGYLTHSQEGYKGLLALQEGLIPVGIEGLDSPQSIIDENDAIDDRNDTKTQRHIPPRPSQKHTKTTSTIKKYRLAFAVTHRFYESLNNQGRDINILLNELMAVVNTFYRTEAGIEFTLAPETSQLIFETAETDVLPDLGRSSSLGLLTDIFNDVIGAESYDIGHVLTTYPGGRAYVGSICSDKKANARSGSGNIFALLHELGHQLGAEHTNSGSMGACRFNHRKNRVEVGGGNSIMSTSCGGQELEERERNPYWVHTHSRQQIKEIVESKNECGISEISDNNYPSVELRSQLIIPANTPFDLLGSGKDDDGDSLLYVWEQTTKRSPTTDFMSMHRDDGFIPLHVSNGNTTNSSVGFVDQNSLLTNNFKVGESLPSVARTLNMNLTAKDGNGGVTTATQKVLVIHSDWGFRLKEAPQFTRWFEDGPKGIFWHTGFSEEFPVQCEYVDIWLSEDNGVTFVPLETAVSNDGAYTFDQYLSANSSYKVKIQCSSSSFFDVSGSTITVQSGSSVSSDSNQNGLDDEYEDNFLQDLPETKSCAKCDADLDGLTNQEEFLLHTSPVKRDSDDDFVTDSLELKLGSSPMSPTDWLVRNKAVESFEDGIQNAVLLNETSINIDASISQLTKESAFDGKFSIRLSRKDGAILTIEAQTDTHITLTFAHKALGSEGLIGVQLNDSDKLYIASDDKWGMHSLKLKPGGNTVRISEDNQISTEILIDYLSFYSITSAPREIQKDMIIDFEASNTAGWDWDLPKSWQIESTPSDSAEAGANILASARTGGFNEFVSVASYSDHFVGSNATFDFRMDTDDTRVELQFAIDGEVQQSWNGAAPWSSAEITIPDGQHELTWTFYKPTFYTRSEHQAFIDNFRFTAATQGKLNMANADTDLDGKTDFILIGERTIHVNNAEHVNSLQIDIPAGRGLPVTGLFDGDQRFDIGIRFPETQSWWLNLSNNSFLSSPENKSQESDLGANKRDIPVVGDYDGDGIDDLAFRRPYNATWYIKNSSRVDLISGKQDGITRKKFGLRLEDIPVPADYDGDGKTDIAFRRPSNFTWYVLNSSGVDNVTGHADGITRKRFGAHINDIPFSADIDGDGKADMVAWRPHKRVFYVLNSSGIDHLSGHGDGISRIKMGTKSGIPTLGDFDGDGIDDLNLYMPADASWSVLLSSSNSLRNFSPFSEDDSLESEKVFPVNVPPVVLIQKMNDWEIPAQPRISLAEEYQYLGGETVFISPHIKGSATPIVFYWQQLSGPSVEFDSASAALSFSAPGLAEDTSLTFRLTMYFEGQGEQHFEVTIPIAASPTIQIANPELNRVTVDYSDFPLDELEGDKLKLTSLSGEWPLQEAVVDIYDSGTSALVYISDENELVNIPALITPNNNNEVLLNASSVVDAIIVMHPTLSLNQPNERFQLLSAFKRSEYYPPLVTVVERKLKNDPYLFTDSKRHPDTWKQVSQAFKNFEENRTTKKQKNNSQQLKSQKPVVDGPRVEYIGDNKIRISNPTTAFYSYRLNNGPWRLLRGNTSAVFADLGEQKQRKDVGVSREISVNNPFVTVELSSRQKLARTANTLKKTCHLLGLFSLCSQEDDDIEILTNTRRDLPDTDALDALINDFGSLISIESNKAIEGIAKLQLERAIRELVKDPNLDKLDVMALKLSKTTLKFVEAVGNLHKYATVNMPFNYDLKYMPSNKTCTVSMDDGATTCGKLPPVAMIAEFINRDSGIAEEVYSESYARNGDRFLEYRWDTNGDGKFNIEWGDRQRIRSENSYRDDPIKITLQVRDSDGVVAQTSQYLKGLAPHTIIYGTAFDDVIDMDFREPRLLTSDEGHIVETLHEVVPLVIGKRGEDMLVLNYQFDRYDGLYWRKLDDFVLGSNRINLNKAENYLIGDWVEGLSFKDNNYKKSLTFFDLGWTIDFSHIKGFRNNTDDVGGAIDYSLLFQPLELVSTAPEKLMTTSPSNTLPGRNFFTLNPKDNYQFIGTDSGDSYQLHNIEYGFEIFTGKGDDTVTGRCIPNFYRGAGHRITNIYYNGGEDTYTIKGCNDDSPWSHFFSDENAHGNQYGEDFRILFNIDYNSLSVSLKKHDAIKVKLYDSDSIRSTRTMFDTTINFGGGNKVHIPGFAVKTVSRTIYDNEEFRISCAGQKTAIYDIGFALRNHVLVFDCAEEKLNIESR